MVRHHPVQHGLDHGDRAAFLPWRVGRPRLPRLQHRVPVRHGRRLGVPRRQRAPSRPRRHHRRNNLPGQRHGGVLPASRHAGMATSPPGLCARIGPRNLRPGHAGQATPRQRPAGRAGQGRRAPGRGRRRLLLALSPARPRRPRRGRTPQAHTSFPGRPAGNQLFIRGRRHGDLRSGVQPPRRTAPHAGRQPDFRGGTRAA